MLQEFYARISRLPILIIFKIGDKDKNVNKVNWIPIHYCTVLI